MATKLVPYVKQVAANSEQPGEVTVHGSLLAGYIREQLTDMKRFRDSIQFVNRLAACLRAREGIYDPAVFADIKAFSGSSVFARLTSNKIRGAASMLRGIFIQGERPWEIKPTPVPTLPDDINAAVDSLIQQETQTMQQAGQPVADAQVKMRRQMLMTAAQDAARRHAAADAVNATRYIDDILVEGNFYTALNEFILDFCTLPMAVLAGPTAVMMTKVRYVNGQPTKTRQATLQYRRVDPYDFMWSPGGTRIEECDVIERQRMNRGALQAMIGLEGYNEDAIRSIIRQHGKKGFSEYDYFDAVRDDIQNRDDQLFQVGLMDVLVFNGAVPGDCLMEYGLSEAEGEPLDPDLDYMAQVWMCDRYIIKAQLDPDPRARIPYYVATYEPVPGSVPGTALPELMGDIQESYNATLRALHNNMAMASGPMVAVNVDRLPPGVDATKIYPWQVWSFLTDPSATAGEKPIEFFQPNINAQELMGVLSFMQQLADEVSAIPRYMTGSNNMGGAGRTASGLSMLMGNATRTMTSVAGSIDANCIYPVIQKTYDLVMLTTGTDILRGDESIEPRGATYAEKRETDRMRMLEFLQNTANPIDMQIIGIPGRAELLRNVADTFMDSQKIVPSEQDIQAMMRQQQAQAAAEQQQAQVDQAGGGPPGSQGGGDPQAPEEQKGQSQQLAAETDNMHRTAQ